MLFFISLFLGRQALRVSRPSIQLLVALMLVMHLLFIDVVAVDPVHGRIKEEISLSASYTDDHDMRLSLIVGGEIFCFPSQCPHQPDPSTLVVLGDAYFENDEQRTWFHDHVRIGDPGDQKGKQKEVHEREQKEQQESSEKNVAFQTWEHVGAAMKVLEMFGLIMQDTMESWSEKLEVAEKSTKIDEATWFSWQLRLNLTCPLLSLRTIRAILPSNRSSYLLSGSNTRSEQCERPSASAPAHRLCYLCERRDKRRRS
ncbi:hypothetical protein EV361DRAFT_681062 [Lentinula raphanica]|nr:hypothetical protein EV361DRAFT_681062 [Lentinula raphanica]